MRRISVLLLVAAVLLGAVVMGRLTSAQEATPAVERILVLPDGLSFEFMGVGTVAELPPAPVEIALVRMTMEPGMTISTEPDDPDFSLIAVESGILTIEADAPLIVQRAAPGTAITADAWPATPEAVDPARAVTLDAGDSVVFPPYVGGDLRNNGTEPVIVVITSIVTTTTAPSGSSVDEEPPQRG